MKSVVFLWFLFAVLQWPAAAQKGLLLYKDAPWDSPQFANATLYKEIEKFPTVHNIVPMSGNKIRVSSALVVKDIVFPTVASLANLTEETHIKVLESEIVDWANASKHYPSAAKYLKPHIAQIQGEIAHFRAGQVKVAGVWMTKEAWLVKKKKAEEERRKLLAKLEAEAKELGMFAEEWASLDEAQRNLIREAKLRAEEAQMRAAEEKRIQEEIEKQRKRAAERAKMKPADRLATDTWITPPELDDKQAKEYEEALAVVQEQLGKAQQHLGFGREVLRMVLKTPERIYTFKPADLSPEMKIERPEEKGKFPVIMPATSSGKELIESLAADSSDHVLVSTIPLQTVEATDVEKLAQGLSHIIELCGGKRAVAKEESKSN